MESEYSKIEGYEAVKVSEFPKELERDVAEAAYTFSELYGFTDFDGDIKGHELMVQIWAIVETIRTNGGFPADLRM